MNQVTRVTQTAADASATTRYILVDLSDTSGFPHKDTGAVVLESLDVQIDKEGSGDYVMRFGVVEEVDGSNGSVTFFHSVHVRGTTSHSSHTPFITSRGQGLSLNVATLAVLGREDVDDSTNWQNDVTLDNATGTAVAPAAGDVVIELEEVSGTATVSFAVSAMYTTTE